MSTGLTFTLLQVTKHSLTTLKNLTVYVNQYTNIHIYVYL